MARQVNQPHPARFVAGCTVSAAATGLLAGLAAQLVRGNRMAPWILGRAAGVLAYLLLVMLVLSGLLLAHPWRSRVRRPPPVARIRAHAVLAVLTAAFTGLHIVVLATDRYAGVGWSGALLPLGAAYRPVATTCGLLGLWAGLLAGITAAFAGRLPLRLWWPIHKCAALSLVAIWLHAVFGGADAARLRWLYVGSAAVLLVAGFGRYAARTGRDELAELPR